MLQNNKISLNFKRIFLILLLVLTGAFLHSFLVVRFRHASETLDQPRYLIVVPGAGITRAGAPSPALRRRLDKAIEIYNDKLVSYIFISGTDFEVISMQHYLAEKNIDSNFIIPDIRGVNTYQTVYNVEEYLKQHHLSNDIAFVSQRYHLPRIALFARRQGMKHCAFIVTEYKNVKAETRRDYLLRETLAYFKAFLLNH